MNLEGKNVTVMGLGLHGGALGTIEWLLAQGALVTATDLKTEEQLATTVQKVQELNGEVTLVLGEHRRKDFVNADVVIRNPAVPRTSEYLAAAREAGVPIEMDSSLFFEHSPSAHIIGITGSKGKTTASNAISKILASHNSETVTVGVDGVSPLGELDRVTETSPVVFELSSWRLEALHERSVSPHMAVVTSIYREHLNTYRDFEEYVETKKSIVRHQTEADIAILNYDDAHLKEWKSEIQSRLFWFSIDTVLAEDGIYIHDDTVVIRVDGEVQEIMPADAIPLQHPFEIRNVLPSILIGHLHGMTASELRDAVETITPLPHRLELVEEIDGVQYVNDSAATMPDATIAALTSLNQSPLVLIIGGSDKNLEFEELGEVVRSAAIRNIVWLPGTATERMQKAVKASVPEENAATMQEAVMLAHASAKAGDTVLLSPGATSFGLFQHEFDRGNQFREAVAALIATS